MASTIPTSRRVNLVINKLTKQSYDLLSADGRLSTELSDQLFMTTDEDEGGSGGGFVLPVATKYTLGGVKIGEGIDVATDGTISASGGSAPSIATKDTLGVVKIGSGIDVATDGTISASGGSGPSMQDVFDAMYPISSVYIAVTDTLPQFFSDHGTWERVSRGACLWGVESGMYDKIGTILPAGLPSLSGCLSSADITGIKASASGEHTHAIIIKARNIANSSNNMVAVSHDTIGIEYNLTKNEGITIDDAGSHTHTITATGVKIKPAADTVYGSSDTVQPPAFVVSMWMRTA